MKIIHIFFKESGITRDFFISSWYLHTIVF